jgi:hypothetical protein
MAALGLDVLTRIVNVSWGGGGAVFVFGTESGNVLYRVRFKDNKDKTPELIEAVLSGEPPETSGGGDSPAFSVIGSSYHLFIENTDAPNEEKNPTFLICGARVVPHFIDDTVGNEVLVYDYHALIYASSNGRNWREVYKDSGVRDVYDTVRILFPVALVWDIAEEAFYYDQHYTFIENVHESTPQILSDQIFSSADGSSWSMVSSTNVGDDPSSYVSPYLTHCAHNNCLDQYGQHVPDGNMGHDIKAQIVARPEKPRAYNYGAGNVGLANDVSNNVEIVEDITGKTSINSVPGMARLNCAASVDGILMAGGDAPGPEGGAPPGIVAFSLDDGETWTTLTSVSNRVITMVSAPAADFSD